MRLDAYSIHKTQALHPCELWGYNIDEMVVIVVITDQMVSVLCPLMMVCSLRFVIEADLSLHRAEWNCQSYMDVVTERRELFHEDSAGATAWHGFRHCIVGTQP